MDKKCLNRAKMPKTPKSKEFIVDIIMIGIMEPECGSNGYGSVHHVVFEGGLINFDHRFSGDLVLHDFLQGRFS